MCLLSRWHLVAAASRRSKVWLLTAIRRRATRVPLAGQAAAPALLWHRPRPESVGAATLARRHEPGPRSRARNCVGRDRQRDVYAACVCPAGTGTTSGLRCSNRATSASPRSTRSPRPVSQMARAGSIPAATRARTTHSQTGTRHALHASRLLLFRMHGRSPSQFSHARVHQNRPRRESSLTSRERSLTSRQWPSAAVLSLSLSLLPVASALSVMIHPASRWTAMMRKSPPAIIDGKLQVPQTVGPWCRAG